MRRLRRPILSSLRTVYPATSYTQGHLSQVLQQFCLSKCPLFPHQSQVVQMFDNSGIMYRQHLFPPESIFQPASFGDVYQPTVDKMVQLGSQCVSGMINPLQADHIFSSTSMPMSPSLDARIIEHLQLAVKPGLKRTTQASLGCAGGIALFNRARDYLLAHPSHTVLTLTVECGSRYWASSYHSQLARLLTEEPSDATQRQILREVVAACVLSDGASAAIMRGSDAPPLVQNLHGLEGGAVSLLDSHTVLLPQTTHLAAHTADASGFRVVLHPLLGASIAKPVKDAIDHLLDRNQVKREHVVGWCLHPGGSRILQGLQQQLELTDQQMSFSRKSLHLHGNSGSVSVLNVLGLALQDLSTAPPLSGDAYIVMAAVGPGITIETLLLQVNRL